LGYHIIIFGVGAVANKVEANLLPTVNIVAYVDNDKTKWGQTRSNTIILSPDSITNLNYDYIIIANRYIREIESQLLVLGISKEKIIKPWKFIGIYSEKLLKKRISYFRENINNVNTLISGLSYIDYAIIPENDAILVSWTHFS